MEALAWEGACQVSIGLALLFVSSFCNMALPRVVGEIVDVVDTKNSRANKNSRTIIHINVFCQHELVKMFKTHSKDYIKCLK